MHTQGEVGGIGRVEGRVEGGGRKAGDRNFPEYTTGGGGNWSVEDWSSN